MVEFNQCHGRIFLGRLLFFDDIINEFGLHMSPVFLIFILGWI